jgi:small subunit ribosomal protein S18
MPPPRKRTTKDTGRKIKKKVCIFCKDRVVWVDYKDVNLLRRFMSDRGKIRARRVTGNCAQHQRDVAIAIKTARELALLPYTQRTTSESRGPRGGGRGRPEAVEARELEPVEADPTGEEPDEGEVEGGEVVIEELAVESNGEVELEEAEVE